MHHFQRWTLQRFVVGISLMACVALTSACESTTTVVESVPSSSSAITTTATAVPATATSIPPTATSVPPTATPAPPGHLTISVNPSSFCGSNPGACTNPLNTLCTSGSFPSVHLVNDGGQSLNWNATASDGSTPPYNTNPTPPVSPNIGALSPGSGTTVHLGTAGFVGAAINLTFTWSGGHTRTLVINCLMP